MPLKRKTSASFVNIDELTVKEIHQAVRDSFTPAIAADRLNLKDASILMQHLGKFILDGEVLSFAQLKALSVKRAQTIWGYLYNQAMTAKSIQIQHYSGEHIYYIITNSKNIRQAAAKLGIQEMALEQYLKQFRIQDHPLTFDELKECTHAEAKLAFGARFQATHQEQRENLTPVTPICYGFAADFDLLPEVLPPGLFDRLPIWLLVNEQETKAASSFKPI